MRKAALGITDILGSIRRDAGCSTRDACAPRKPRKLGLKYRKSAVDRPAKALLFSPDDSPNDVLPILQLRENAAERLHHRRDELLEEPGREAELFPIKNPAAQDAADHVVAAFVAGQDAVGNGAGYAAGMVGEHAKRHIDVLLVGKSFA